MLKLLPLAILGVCLAACSASPGSMTDVRPAWPTRGWPSSTPEAEGLDPAALGTLDAEFASGSRGQITGMLVIRHGRVVFEKSYTHDFDKLFEGTRSTSTAPSTRCSR